MVFGLLKKIKKKKAAKKKRQVKAATAGLSARPPVPPHLCGLRVTPSARAHYLNLRLDARASEIVLTWPTRRRVTLDKAIRFIQENRSWIARQQKDLPVARHFAPAVTLTIAGKPYVIVRKDGRGVTHLEGDKLIVFGQAEHLQRRVRDFLKEEALRQLTALAARKAARLGLKPSDVRVLDPKTRWGSCGPDGKIMFSWRLILAPPAIMDYLVAHEVAHRVHLNHGRRFWKLCAELTSGDVAACRAWLHEQGKTLMVWN